MEATASSSSSPPPPPPPPAPSPSPPPAAAAAAGEEPPAQEAAAAAAVEVDAVGEVEVEVEATGGEEEEAECGFCLFMKGGGCKEEFVAWEQCVEAAEAAGGDVVERCFEVTAALRKCMDAHADYYEPILRAERALAEDLESQGRDLPPPPEAAASEAAAPEAEKKADPSKS